MQPFAELPPFEVWYSDASAFFGARARTELRGSDRHTNNNVYGLYRDDRGDLPRARYVSLRIYEPHQRLRIDYFRVHGTAAAPQSPPSLTGAAAAAAAAAVAAAAAAAAAIAVSKVPAEVTGAAV